MRRQNWMTAGLTLMVVLSCMVPTGATADTDAKNSREREMLRRAQEALRQSQADNSDLEQRKAEAERKLKDAQDQIEAARNASKSAQAALRTQSQAAATTQADLTRQLDEAHRQLAALGARQQETATQLAAREAQLKETQQDLASSRAATSSCEAKNLKLYEYSQDLVQRYQKKGVWAALSQKEPVLGIGEVGVQNVVEEYREKFDSQQIKTSAAPSSAPHAP